MTETIRFAEEISTNRKATSLTKGIIDGALDQIEVATHDWFYSFQMHELDHHRAGHFEEYPQKGDDF